MLLLDATSGQEIALLIVDPCRLMDHRRLILVVVAVLLWAVLAGLILFVFGGCYR